MIPLYRRSAFQVALLMFCTFGLYVFFWAFYARRAAAAILEKNDQPLWKAIALIVPLFNLFLLFDLGQMVQGVKWRTDPSRRDEWLPWLGVSVFVFNVLDRVPTDFANLGSLGYAPIALVQQAFSRAQIALYGEAALPAKFHWLEWTAIVLGAGVWVFGAAGIMLAAPAEFSLGAKRWYVASLILAVAGLVLFYRSSRAAVAQGLAMYANPAPDRIAPPVYNAPV